MPFLPAALSAAKWATFGLLGGVGIGFAGASRADKIVSAAALSIIAYELVRSR